MAKHFTKEIKYHYVMRYRNGESPTIIAREIILNNLTNSTTPKIVTFYLRKWNKELEVNGYLSDSKSGLSTGTNQGRPKKRKHKPYEEMTRDELIEYNKMRDALIEELQKIRDEEKKKKFMIIEKYSTSFSISMMCQELGVSRSGYYKWKNNGMKLSPKRSLELQNIIISTFRDNKANYGFRRVHIQMQKTNPDIKVNLNTVRKYMRELDLKAKIRTKSKHRETKNTNIKIANLIERNFKSDKPNQKAYTDVSYIQMKNGWGFCSVFIDGFDNSIMDIKLGARNDLQLVLDNAKDALKHDSYDKLIVHSDHGTQYSTSLFKSMLSEKNIKQSMSRVGNSLDNRPAEYFFSILKQEYLRHIPIQERTFDRIQKLFIEVKNHYNTMRFQSCLQNKTPHEYMRCFS